MSYRAYRTDGRRMALLCDGRLDPNTAKTATGLLIWCPDEVVAVVDREHAGQDLEQVVGCGKGIPIVPTVVEAARLGANQLVIGVANLGGVMVPGYRDRIIEAIGLGCDVVNGLHQLLSDDAELVRLAEQRGATLYDVRLVPDVPVGMNRARSVDNNRVLTVGSDCNVGKKMSTLALAREFAARGLDAQYLATGQTGIMISGAGYCIDRAISDFASGLAEKMVLDAADHRWLFIEGQGSIDHPAYSGVTLSLLHGTAPQALVLCHVHSRAGRRHDEGTPLLPLAEYVRLYETISAPVLPAKVVGVSVNTWGLDEAGARAELKRVEDSVSLPAADPLRFGAAGLADALIAFFERR